MAPEEFQRRLRNLESMFRRLDRGELTGRNCKSSDGTRRRAYEVLDAAIREDARTDEAPLCAWLDDNPSVVSRWSRIERRSVGLPV